MRSHFARIFAVLALAVGLWAAPASAQHTLNVRDADIRAFVQDAAKVTGRTFILDSRVQGKVSVVTDRPLSRSEYFEIFLSTLRANNLVAIPTTRGAYRIQPADGAASQPSRIGSRGAEGNQLVTEVVRLKSIVATEALETLRPLVSKQGSITANRNANSLVIVDYADNIRRIRSLVGEIDRDSAASTIITLKNAGAREIATSLQALAAQGGGEGQQQQYRPARRSRCGVALCANGPGTGQGGRIGHRDSRAPAGLCQCRAAVAGDREFAGQQWHQRQFRDRCACGHGRRGIRSCSRCHQWR